MGDTCRQVRWKRYRPAMDAIGDQIHAFIDTEEAVRLLAKYYGGGYTGSRFDAAEQLTSPDANCFTAHDIAAVATLSVPLPGSAVVGLLERQDKLTELLLDVPTDIDLAAADDDLIEAIFAVQRELDDVKGVGHVTRSKPFAHKRPRLVPIRDQHVLTALIGQDYGPLTLPMRDTLRHDPSIVERLDDVQRRSGIPVSISSLRALDVVVWMATHGDGQVPSDSRSVPNS